jgi:hypothetical protein
MKKQSQILKISHTVEPAQHCQDLRTPAQESDEQKWKRLAELSRLANTCSLIEHNGQFYQSINT